MSATIQEHIDAEKQIEALVGAGATDMLVSILLDDQIRGLAEDWNDNVRHWEEKTMTTTAQRISDALGNDGQCWTTAGGITFDTLVHSHRHLCEWRDGWHTGDVYRLTFLDGSIITVAGDAWDLGFSDCFCWEGAQNEDCKSSHLPLIESFS